MLYARAFAALIKTIETKMDNASQAQGARELAEAF